MNITTEGNDEFRWKSKRPEIDKIERHDNPQNLLTNQTPNI